VETVEMRKNLAELIERLNKRLGDNRGEEMMFKELGNEIA
jgi:hypothetical protein